MKLILSFYAILIIAASAECGLVKQFFGNVKEDVHYVVDGTVSVLGKGTHKLTEGLGVFLHRNEGNKLSGPKTEATPSNSLNNKKLEDTDYNHGAIYDNYDGNDAQNYNNVQSTPITVNAEPTSKTEEILKSDNNQLVTNQQKEPTTESNSNKNVNEHEAVSTTENVYDHVLVQTLVATTTETSWLNGAELESILPTITHNETHFTGNTNELSIGEDPNEEIKKSNNKTAKCDDSIKPVHENNDIKAGLVSDQMFFNDNKPKGNETNTNYVCAEGLVRTANGECLKQIEIDVSKKVEPMVSNIFVADACASGFARALDGSCQKIVG